MSGLFLGLGDGCKDGENLLTIVIDALKGNIVVDVATLMQQFQPILCFTGLFQRNEQLGIEVSPCLRTDCLFYISSN